MPDPLAPRAHQIVDAALELLEADGADALSMRRVADRVGIRAPSIYEHLADKRALEAAIISRGFELLANASEQTVTGAADPLAALATVYRSFAADHPHLYRLMTARELDRDLARAIWAFAHGMLILELDRRFPPEADLDAAWARGLAAFRTAR